MNAIADMPWVRSTMKNVYGPRPCPACGSGRADDAGAKNDFPLCVCRQCRTVFTARLPSVSDAQDYDGYYDGHNLTVPEFIGRRLQEIVGAFASFRSNNRLLDVGFGAGSLLREAARSGWKACGVEVSRPAVEQARVQGLDVYHGDLAEARYPEGHFDVVCAVEIVEHLSRPGELLTEVARILRPGGLFWATTPHARGLSFRLLGARWSIVSPPEHLQLFSATGMRKLLGEAGFRQANLTTRGLNVVELFRKLRPRQVEGKKSMGVRQSCKEDGFDRVGSSYRLNEMLTRSRWRRGIKTLLNGLLHSASLGDSLAIHATK